MFLRSFGVILLLAPFVLPGAVPAAPRRPAVARPDRTRAAELIINGTNRFRKQQGRAPVKANARLTETARSFAEYLARTGKFSHEADGKTPSQRAKEHGYDYCLVLENIAWQSSSRGFSTAELAGKLVRGWQDSPGHRKNMLDPDVTETGVAVAQGKKGRYYAVQLFGRPESQKIQFEVVNRTEATVSYRTGGKTITLRPRHAYKHWQCRPPEVTFLWPEKTDREGTTVRPGNGDRLAVVRGRDGRFEVRKE